MTAGVITYREVGPQDFDALFALVSIWDVTRNLGSWSWPPDEALARERTQPFQGEGFVWVMCKDGAFIGTVSVVRGALGYMLHPDHHGKGIMQNAVRDALSNAFESSGVQEVTADIWADNVASKHILTKFGFTLTVQEVVHALARDEPTESETYRLTREAWFSRNPPRLVTQRLVLRPLTSQDAEMIVRIAGNYEVSKWLQPVPHPYDLSDAHEFLNRVECGDEGPVWAITQRDEPIGVIGVDDILGYYLQPESWGHGLMSEAVDAVVAWRFTDSALDRIKSGYFDGNHGSCRVLEKAGFNHVGQDIRFCTARNEKVPHHNVDLTRERWSALKQAHE